MNVYFNSQDTNYKAPFGAVECGTEITFRFFAPEADGVVLRTWMDGRGEERIEMHRYGDYFICKAQTPETPCLFWYFFLIYTKDGVYYYGNNSAELGGEGQLSDREPPSFQITVHKPFHTPDWFKHSILYYIFPDRFNRGSDFEKKKEQIEEAEPPKGPGRFFERDWFSRPSYEKNEDGTIRRWQFYGGTLKGISEKLPYIKSLGADAIYLCPIFRSGSNHRYDTADYMSIDPLLGDEAGFQEFCSHAREEGISIILDGVFSHTGADSIYFDRFGNYGGQGAYNNPDSEYYPWYSFHEDGTYEAWWGDQNLPNVDETYPTYMEFICGENGVLDKWLKNGARGFRLDVADELPDSFIKEIRRTIKSHDSSNLLLGEVWEDASRKVSYGVLREYLLGDELDGTMNYPFRKAILHFLMGRCTSNEFCTKVMSIVENYPAECLFTMINMLGSHDRKRPLTALSIGAYIPEELQQGYSLTGIDYELARRRLKIASTLQYCLPGVPVIYYGDEAGLQGHADPYNRAAYPWGKEDEEILSHYRKLGEIYKEHPALHTGNIKLYAMGEDVIALHRSSDNEKLVILVNRNWQNPIVVSVDTKDYDSALDLYNGEYFDAESDSILLKVEPTSARIILLKD